MKYVVLKDGTRINNCTNATTSDSIYVACNSYEDCGKVRDKFNSDNSIIVSVYKVVEGEADILETRGTDMVLIDGCKMYHENDKCVCLVSLRRKTHIETIDEQIVELQEAVLG